MNFRTISVAALALALAACGDAASSEAEDSDVSSQAGDADAGGTASSSGERASDTGSKDASDADTSEAKTNAAATDDMADNSAASDKADGPSKPVECTVTSPPSDMSYTGQCEYFVLGGDSFTMVRTDGQPFFYGILEIIVEADTPTAAGLSVRTADGERDGYGTAAREPGEQCWINDSLDVCWKDL